MANSNGIRHSETETKKEPADSALAPLAHPHRNTITDPVKADK